MISPTVPLTPTLKEYWLLLVPYAEAGDILTIGEAAEVFGITYSPARRALLQLRKAGLPIPTQVGTCGSVGKCPRCKEELAEAVVPGGRGQPTTTTRWCPECGWDEGKQ